MCVRVEEEGCEAPVALREAPVALREEVAQRPENVMRVCVCVRVCNGVLSKSQELPSKSFCNLWTCVCVCVCVCVFVCALSDGSVMR